MLLSHADGLGGLTSARGHWHSREHIRTELGNDVDTIMETFSTRGGPVFAIVGPYDADPIATTWEGVRRFYTSIRETIDVHAVTDFFEIANDWMAFREGLFELRPLGGGDPIYRSYVSLVAADDTGVRVDMAWSVEPYPGGHRRARALEPGEVRSEVRDLRRFRELLDAWREGDADAAAEFVTPDARLIIPVFLPDDPRLIAALSGRDAYRDHLWALFDAYTVRDVELLDINVGDWYVFAETTWILEDRQSSATLAVRSAVSHQLDAQGRISGMLGAAMQI
jgi:hypothetical protein